MELFLGFYFGSLTMIALYNFLWYRISKDKSYFYYALFKAAMICIVWQTAIVHEPNQLLMSVNILAILLLILLFSREFLGLKKNFGSMNTMFHFAAALVIVGFFYSIFFDEYAIFDQPYFLVLMPLVLLGVYVYRKGFEPAKYYVLAWGISIALIGLDEVLAAMGVDYFSHVPFTQIGQLIESIILSYAISVKTSLMVREKEQQSRILMYQAKLASMGQMLESISHQWRQPLNRISTYIINMQMYIEKKEGRENYLLEALTGSQVQLEYMSNTISDFTKFNRHEDEKEKFMVSTVVEDVLSIIGVTLEQNDIKFGLQVNEDFELFSFPNELAQVILNLVQNSQDALLSNDVDEPCIKVIISDQSICVEDNAGGVPQSIVNQIFEPYFTTKSKSSSLGLGLYMSKLILEKYFDAELSLDQRDNVTSFHILFL